MAENFTKLFSSITASTVWLEDSDTRIVWVTMLAMADHDGYVGASIPGLASIARVPVEKVRAALEKFKAPDPDSRSKEHEGRRIEEVDRGWVLLNHARFRELRAEAERRERDRVRQQRKRDREKADGVTDDVTDRHAVTRDDVTNPKSHVFSSDSVSSGSGSVVASDPDPERAILGARTWQEAKTAELPNPGLWDAAKWLRMFDRAWCTIYGGHASGGGSKTAQACAELGDRLAAMTPEERLAAQERSPAMFREWFADSSPKVLSARHPFSWFVVQFDALRRERRSAPRAGPGQKTGMELAQGNLAAADAWLEGKATDGSI